MEGWRSFGARLRSSGRDESRRGGEQWPARRTAATLLDLPPLELEDGDGRGGRDGAGRFEGVREDTSRGQTSRIAGIADAWRRRRRAQAPVWPASVTVETLELSLLTRLNDFDSSLTR